jgi:heterodisulfide reductase subunit D
MKSVLKEFLDQEKNKLLEECTLCGNCLRECPIIPYTTIKDHDPVELQQKTLDFFKEGKFSQEVYDFSYICMTCESCDTLCPVEGLYPSRKSEIIKTEMLALGKDIPQAATFFLPSNKYNLPAILSSLQMKPSEIRWLENIPETPKKTEVVFFLGCFAHTGPDKIFTAIDILSQLNQDFVTLGGGENACCGAAYALVGNIEESEKAARKLLDSIAAFQPQYAVFWCPSCVFRLSTIFPSYMTESIKYQHISTFLANNIEQLNFTKELNKVVTVHDPCHLARGLGEYEASRKILSKIPGVTVVEMRHNKENTLCCGAAAGLGDTEAAKAFTSQRLNEAKECGADTLVSLCPGCQMSFFPGEFTHGLSVKTLIELVGEAMGISYEDKFKKLAMLGDPNKIIEAAKENIEASKYSLEEMQMIVPQIFQS